MPELHGKLLNSSRTGYQSRMGLWEDLLIREACMNWADRIVTGSISDPELILKCFGCFFTVKFYFLKM